MPCVLHGPAVAAGGKAEAHKDPKSVADVEPGAWASFLGDLRSLLQLPRYADAFVLDADCVGLFLFCAGVDVGVVGDLAPRVSRDGLSDPCAALLPPLAQLLQRGGAVGSVGGGAALAVTRGAVVTSGAIDRLLIRLGRLVSCGARDPAWVAQFESPAEVRCYVRTCVLCGPACFVCVRVCTLWGLA